MKKILLILALTLAACTEAPEMPKAQPIGFTQYQPFQVNVANVEIVGDYKSPQKAPYVEHLFPTSPEDAMRAWVRDRIRVTGGSGSLQVIIKDASVKQENLAKTEGIKGAFTNDQAARYDARLEIEMRIYNGRSISEANLNTVATRSDMLPENASPLSRDKMFDAMIKKLMDEMNAELEKNIHTYFNRFLDYNAG